MPFQTRDDRLAANAERAEKNKVTRAERKQKRATRKEMKDALQGARSSGERREIKEAYKTPPPQSSAQDVAGYTSSVVSGTDDGSGGGGAGGGATITLGAVLSGNIAGQVEVTGVIL